MKKIIKYLTILALITIAPSVQAKEINHFTSKIDNEVTIEDKYNASVAAAGENIYFNGEINGISFGAGNKLTFEGTSDYVALAGNVIEINGTIKNDLILAGNLITIDKDAKINRDTIIAGNDIEINGTFDRNITIYASKVTFKNAKIKGHVKLDVNTIEIQKETTIEQTLSYPEDSIYKVEEGATIENTEKTAAIQKEDDENYFATVPAKIWSFLCLTLIFAAITLLFPNVFDKMNNKYEKVEFSEIIEIFTKGIVTLILVPIIMILLFCTLIGIPLAIIILLLYGIAIYISSIFTAYLIGYKIWQKVFDKDINILGLGIIGLFILFLCSLIPGVRILVSIIATLVGLGIIINIFKKEK